MRPPRVSHMTFDGQNGLTTSVTRLKRTLLLIPCLVSACVVACSRPPYAQSISGVLLKAGQGAAGVRVRFKSTQSASACVEGLDGVTAPDGRFHLDQTYWPSMIEKLVVVVHPYELCVAVGGAWKPLWQETAGPAPRSIELECNVDDTSKGACRASWDHQGFK